MSSGPAKGRDYAIEEPTAAEIVEAVSRTLGAEEGARAWKRACLACQRDKPGMLRTAADLMAVLAEMAKEPGLTQVVARSNIIRLHTWTVLSGHRRVPV